ncbi:ROK family protein [Arcicella sp. LKC2W]|uniref:ROK family protein n=1 Tax=Arcicella sp. LKC2W TaxID=2984198 RepID=UPI002B1F3CE9|nr:ROK family protein [Arcicella sp. LKC2W]MEA5460212.1 ROK family protein [Arcicella sp. LKC2W]
MSTKKLSNKNRIIKQLYFSGSMSCADFSMQLNKSLPFITKLVNDLVEEDVIVETGFAPSTGGRRPLMYSLKPETLYIVSVSMDQFITRIALMDTNNQVIGEVEKVELALSDNHNSLLTLYEELEKFIQSSKVDRKKIVGIGIGMPGFVDIKNGINHSFLKTPLTYGNESITQFISEKLDIPVFIDNDSSVIALAELRFGEGINRKNIMVVNVGWGVGLGMVLNGNLYRGASGFAGEFSHIPLFTNNKLCSCGKSGCLETETSLSVLIEKFKEAIAQGRVSRLKEVPANNIEQASELIVQYAIEGDRLAVELLSEIGYKIGRGVAILIHLLNPELIILSGRGTQAGQIWQAPIQQALNEHCIPRLSHNTPIKISKLGFDASLIGAAALVMENYDHIYSS